MLAGATDRSLYEVTFPTEVSSAPPRNTSYPVTPTASSDASQLSCTSPADAATARRLPGTVGGVVSPVVPPPPPVVMISWGVLAPASLLLMLVAVVLGEVSARLSAPFAIPWVAIGISTGVAAVSRPEDPSTAPVPGWLAKVNAVSPQAVSDTLRTSTPRLLPLTGTRRSLALETVAPSPDRLNRR